MDPNSVSRTARGLHGAHLGSGVDGLYWLISLHFPRSSLQNLIIGFYAFLVSPTRQEIPIGRQGEAGRDQGVELGSRDPSNQRGVGRFPAAPSGGGRQSCGPGPVSQALPWPRPTRSCERPLAGRERHCRKPGVAGWVGGRGLESSVGLEHQGPMEAAALCHLRTAQNTVSISIIVILIINRMKMHGMINTQQLTRSSPTFRL